MPVGSIVDIQPEDGNQSDPLILEAKRLFGIDYLYPYQRLAVHNILSAAGYYSGEAEDAAPGDQIVLLPTGAGKSLCFQLPSLLVTGITLVVYPLLSLMADQERRLRSVNIEPGVLRGGQDTSERKDLFRSLEEGRTRILLANPEALLSPEAKRFLEKIGVAHFVIDEAHCVSEWGETFRPAYLELGWLRDDFHAGVLTAFTATASPEVLSRIVKYLFGGKSPHVIAADPDRPNIHYSAVPCLSKIHKLSRLLGSRAQHSAGGAAGRSGPAAELPAVVFCRSRRGAELTAGVLRRRLESNDVFFYHAGLSREEKKKVENWFFPSETGILVATCAYGMGVDKKNIRTVIHYDVPGSAEAYLQESGRAGRDGKPSRAVLLFSEADKLLLFRSTRESDKRRFAALLDYAVSQNCRRQGLLRLLGWEAGGCSGCDRCDGTALTRPEDQDRILRFVRSNKRRFTAEQTAAILSGRRSYEALRQGLLGVPGFGLLPDWDPEDLSEAIEELSKKGAVYKSKGLWKQRLSARHPFSLFEKNEKLLP